MTKPTSRHLKTVAILLTLALLTGCAHRPKKDGPPNFYVDETKIANAVPKKEPLSKLGNMHSYKVFGKRYYTLRNSKQFSETGIASWYGSQFHRKNTSSGEPYNMLAMTAAHKTLPLPTYVEVTNLNNQRKIIVKVNDRGPFASNRIIDLSYVAAKKLGMLGRGTARVRVRAIDLNAHNKKSHQQQSSWRQPVDEQAIYLQVGSFKNISNAKKLKQRLMAMLKAPVKIFRSKNRLYRVQVGPIHDHATVSRLTDRLKGIGITPNKTFGA